MTTNAEAKEILEFWAKAGPAKWWTKDKDFDEQIAARFFILHQKAVEGQLDDWESESPDSALALIILLDQFSRNLYRGEAKAFYADPKALSLCHRVLGSGLDKGMRVDLKSFAYMPLMHSEALADQELSVELSEREMEEAGVEAAIEHREIIRRFGRFPHRNEILGRSSTEAEVSYLESGGFHG